MIRRAFVLLAGCVALAACVEAPPRYYAGQPYGTGVVGGELAPRGALPYGVPPAAPPPPRGVALLAPLTGPNAERGAALVNAARLALDLPGAPILTVRDTGGTEPGAANAAREAITGGAALIIGPLTAAETRGAAAAARGTGVAVLAFTNDASQAQPGVWTLGITPGQQVRRLATAVANLGKPRFAALLPQTEFGTAMSAALIDATSALHLPSPNIHTYSSDSMEAAVRELAPSAVATAPATGDALSSYLAQLRADGAAPPPPGAAPGTPAPLAPEAPPPPNFDALLLAETGKPLATLTGLLQSAGVAAPAVRMLGPVLWAVPSVRAGAMLKGAWYAAPDPTKRSAFDAAYTARYGTGAPGITDFAYDAASVARVLGAGEGYSTSSLCRSDGYAGVDGVFALQPDGQVRRGLALFELQQGAPQMIEGSPATVSAPGI